MYVYSYVMFSSWWLTGIYVSKSYLIITVATCIYSYSCAHYVCDWNWEKRHFLHTMLKHNTCTDFINIKINIYTLTDGYIAIYVLQYANLYVCVAICQQLIILFLLCMWLVSQTCQTSMSTCVVLIWFCWLLATLCGT